eukprot:scaffold6994_cov145-Skeletonema_dohrnii-CCMP3373.AAC.7
MMREWRERHVEERDMADSRSMNVSIVGQHISIAAVGIMMTKRDSEAIDYRRRITLLSSRERYKCSLGEIGWLDLNFGEIMGMNCLM